MQIKGTVDRATASRLPGAAVSLNGVRGAGRVTRYWRSRSNRQRVLVICICLGPWAIGFLVFELYPVLASLYFSFTNYSVLSPSRWVGLLNYRNLASDPLFWQALRVTVIYTAVAVPLSIIIGYSIALLLAQKVKWLSVWRTVYFLPSIVPIIASSFVFAWLLNPVFGPVDSALGKVGLPQPGWFASPKWVVPAIILMQLWMSGANLVLYLAAMHQVPAALYEAAEIEGARGWYKLRHITLPMTSPVILFTFITGVIFSVQVFTPAYVITNGGPANASLFYLLYLYQQGWQNLSMGYASAMAWILLVLVAVLTAVTLLVARRVVYYGYGEGVRA